MDVLRRAVSLLRQDAALRRQALRPLGWAAILYVLVVVLAIFLGGLIGSHVSDSARIFGEAAAFLSALVLAPVVYLLALGFVIGFALDELSRGVERSVTGKVVGQPVSFARGLADGFVRTLFAAGMGLVAFCAGAFGLVPVSWLIAACLGTMDATAPALLRRGVGFGRQFGVVRGLPHVWSFAGLAGLVLLVPIVNVLAVPILVVAGTLLVVDAEQGASVGG